MGFLQSIGGLKSEATRLDAHGQPVNSRFNQRRVEDRQIDELIGLCKMALSDGAVDQLEVETLLSWLGANRECADVWPANVIYERVYRALADDGVVDAEEESEILDILLKTVGGVRQVENKSSSLPLCNPAPDIDFVARVFCFTGKFNLGTRGYCEGLIEKRGGSSVGAPTRSTDYLVIGDLGSGSWIHSSFGRKIQKAVEMRGDDHGISIISEHHLKEFL